MPTSMQGSGGTHRRLHDQGRLRGPEFRGAANAVRREAEAANRERLRSIDDEEARAKSAAQNEAVKPAKKGKK